MTAINVVTSCSAKGWQDYGQRFVETFIRHWPVEVALHVVSEDDLPASDDILRRARLWNLFKESPPAMAFDLRHHDNVRSHGRIELSGDAGWKPSKRDRGYNFRYDAYRFAKKPFAIALVAAHVPGGRLFWIDADVVTFRPPPLELLARLLPDDAAICCLDRGNYHSECGFVGYNLDVPSTRQFIERFADLYASDEVFGLGEWHDSWVFDWLRRQMAIPTYAIPHNDRHHPFVNSELGYYMDHLKGARKDKGRTPIEQVLSSKKRSMPYWRGASQ